MTTAAYAAQTKSSPLAPFEVTRRDPRADDVVIDILYCGVCHSDIHQTRNEWGFSAFPMVPGHEIVGRVSTVGSDVTKYSPGDMVAVGCIVDSCQDCASCEAGLEQYCENNATQTYNDKDRVDRSPTFGGYSKNIVVKESFVLSMPKSLDLASAAPLLCAGITTYSPLRHWNIGKESSVAVIGLGGLGHMGLKFAKAMGAEVTLFTRTPDKEPEARRLGADYVVLSTDPAQMEASARKFDFILDTVPNPHDINPYLMTLKLNGCLCIVGQLTPIEPPVSSIAVITGRRSISGSGIGGIAETQEMLNFCAETGITCDVEMIKIQDINKAYTRVINSDVRYRFVIDMSSL